ncbi:MAG: HD domain-containing protein [Desulfobacterales bacterium]|nr:HD domain-containing protein [Desulfobacterales bacterium]
MLLNVTKFDLIKGLSGAFDLVSPQLVGHHKQVAYISTRIANQLEFDISEQLTIAMSGLVHDAGALHKTSKDLLKLLNFESNDPHHAEVGFKLLGIFPVFTDIAKIVRYHHLHWDEGRGEESNGEEVPIASHIIHLADRIAVLIKKEGLLSNVKEITEKIKPLTGKKFHPLLVEAFLNLAEKESFWLDLVFSRSPMLFMEDNILLEEVPLDINEIVDLTNVFSQIIDFQSRFTVTHSSGVAASAQKIAELSGFTKEDQLLITISGFLHDLGKLAVPKEILEAPRKLTLNEINIVKSHSYFTYQILKKIPAFKKINQWASYHHEKINGEGYPFHLTGNEMDLGSKIIGVADVFTAITEDRPYRKSLSEKESLKILKNMAKDNSLDSSTVNVMEQHFNEINEFRHLAQEKAAVRYSFFYTQLSNPIL